LSSDWPSHRAISTTHREAPITYNIIL
jgi:hypothetical protein